MNRGIRLGKDRTTMSEMPFKPKEIQQLARRWHKKQVAWRRHLHQYPEIANQETNTTAFLKKELHQIGLKILPLKLKTGVLAEVKGKQPGPTVAIRSDIDALPLQEETGVSYASKNFGRMHACGHDVHMATMLGVAAALAEWRDKLTGNVRFIFQPAEEDPPGGARFMIEQGALDNVDTIFGMHVDPHLKV
ncbi:MAG: amidohydrolase, partial [candidate division Zixibacteria bacterium]|nr:amidohydrolase [candidate division Zixibacteria bacterium]